MSVARPASLVKIPIAAGNLVAGSRVLFGSVPVTVTNAVQHHGNVTVSVVGRDGGLQVRSFPVGRTLAAAPAHLFA